MSKRSNTLLHVTFTLVVLFLVFFSIQSVIADDGSEVISSAISMDEIVPVWQTEALTQLPISFTENMGQAPEEIAFVIQSAGYLFGFTNDGFYFIPSIDPLDESIDSVPVTKMTVEGADPDTMVRGTDLLPGVAHYLIGSDESDWLTDVATYAGIIYDNVLPGIELSYSGIEGILKREFLLEPGVTPESIILVYDGVESLELAEDGTLLVHSAAGIMSESAPVSYQVVDGVRAYLESSFVILSENKVSFYVDGYDPALPLVIDPYLIYSTLFGGTKHDGVMDMAVDASGNVYLTGFTESTNFPTVNPLPYTFRQPTTAFVTKISHTAGNQALIEFSTYLGGSGSDIGHGIAVDSSGSIFVTGETTSPNFPVHRPIQDGGTCRGGTDAFVTRLLPNGAGIRYSTYIGGTGEDVAHSIFVHNGEAYITGKTQGSNPIPSNRYPTTAGAYQTESLGGLLSDAFVSRINDSGSTAKLVYSTYLSGSSVDVGNDIVVDRFGNIYVVGTTSSPDLIPLSVPGFQKQIGDVNDAFVMKISPSHKKGKDLLYATYLGGKGNDEGEAIALDLEDYVYVTGTTTSTDFPTTPKAYRPEKIIKQGPDTDIFIAKLNTGNSNPPIYSTYLGGSKNEGVYDIYVDSKNQAYVAGYTYSNDYPLQDPFPKTRVSGKDAIVTGLDKNGRDLILSVVFGGHDEDCAHAVYVSAAGEVYVAGHTSSKTFHDGGYQYNVNCDAKCWNDTFPVHLSVLSHAGYAKQGGSDAFVMKFSPSGPVGASFDFIRQGPNNILLPGAVVEFQAEVDDPTIVSFTLFFGDGSNSGPFTRPFGWISHPYANPGRYTVELCGSNAAGVVVRCESKIDYVIVEADPGPLLNSRKFFVSNNLVDASPVNVLENTSFELRWVGEPQPDLIQWQFDTGSGVIQRLSRNSTSTRVTVSEGLPLPPPPGQYAVIATPYYYSEAEQMLIPGRTVARYNYIQVLSLPKIWFSPTGVVGSYKPGPGYVELPVPPISNPPTEVWMQAEPPWDVYSVERWDYGDGLTSGVLPVVGPTSHQYPNKIGEYFPVVTISHPTLGKISSQKIDVNKVIVFNEIRPNFDWYPKDPMAGEAITFSYNGTGKPIEWQWDFGTSSKNSTLQSPSYMYDSAGEYSVLLGVKKPSGEWTYSPQYNITVAHTAPDLVRLTWDPKPSSTPLQLFSSSPREISIMLDSPKLGLDTYQVTATITNTSVVAFTGKGKPPTWVGRDYFEIKGNNAVKPGLYESVTVYGISPSIGNMNPISLGMLEIQGIADGTAKIVYSHPELGYGTNGRYRVSLDGLNITMQTLPHLILCPGCGPQADLNGDGLIDDFDGNGVINSNDVRVFFNAYSDLKESGNPLLYDYNRNGGLDLQDIVVYAQMIGYLSATNQEMNENDR